MKRNISDLLDGYEEEEIDLRVDGALNLRRMKELTMKNVKSTRVKRRFASARVLLIAAVVVAITCSALAVGYTLKAGDWFKDFFGTAEKPISTEQREVLNDIGATFDGSVTSNGTTVTPIAAIADENMYYLRLRIEAPKGTVLPEYNDEVDGYYQLSGNTAEDVIEIKYPDDPERSFGYTMNFDWLPDDTPTDNIKEVVFNIHAQPGMGNGFTDGTPKHLIFHGLWLQSPDKVYTQLLSGDFEIDMGQYESRVINLDCEGLSWYDENTTCTSYLHKMALSPLSFSYAYTYTGVNDTRYRESVGPLTIVMEDGTELPLGIELDGPGGGDREGNTTGVKIFAEPLDLSQVDYVLYGDQRIDLPE